MCTLCIVYMAGPLRIRAGEPAHSARHREVPTTHVSVFWRSSASQTRWSLSQPVYLLCVHVQVLACQLYDKRRTCGSSHSVYHTIIYRRITRGIVGENSPQAGLAFESTTASGIIQQVQLCSIIVLLSTVEMT